MFFHIHVQVVKMIGFMDTAAIQRKDIDKGRSIIVGIATSTTVRHLPRIIEVLKARHEGMGLNATARSFSVSKKSVIDWERRLAELRPTLMLY
jgi:hypothetical protein